MKILLICSFTIGILLLPHKAWSRNKEIMFIRQNTKIVDVQFIDRFGNTTILPFENKDTLSISATDYINVVNISNGKLRCWTLPAGETIWLAKPENGTLQLRSHSDERNNELYYLNIYGLFPTTEKIIAKEDPSFENAKKILDDRLEKLDLTNKISRNFYDEELEHIYCDYLLAYIGDNVPQKSPVVVNNLRASLLLQLKHPYLLSARILMKQYLKILLTQHSFKEVYNDCLMKFDGKTKEYLLFALLNDNRSEINGSYIGGLNDVSFRDYLLNNNSFRKVQVSNEDSNMLINTEGKTIKLAELLQSKQGKMVYVDIWASWCVPCLREMPYSVVLKEKYQYVEFIYLSIDKDFSAWKNKMKELQIPTNNSFLFIKPKESQFLKDLKVTAIPRYLLLDTAHKVLNKDAPKPSDPKLPDYFKSL